LPPDPRLPSETQPPPLTTVGVLGRLAAIGVVVAAVAGGFVYAGGWLSPGELTQGRIIDTFQEVAGIHPGFRRNHAKGVCIAGSFNSDGEGARLSSAVVFALGRVPVIGRFAIAGPQPYGPDAPVSVRSMALRFSLPDGEEWRTGMNSIPVFAVNTPQGFTDQLLASKPDPATGKPDPAAMKAFLANHPETVKALAIIKNTPLSSGFDNTTYHSLDAFRFINAAGVSTPVRWMMVPVEPFAPEDPAQSAQGDKNYLFDALIARLAQGPLQWHLMIVVGQPGDPTNDATIPWPAGREQVDAGTLTIDHIEAEGPGNCRDVNFDPLVLPSGIAPSDDPLLSARSAAYAQSFTRRAGEPKQPSAVQIPETSKGAAQ
jgi:catalase